MSKPDPEETRQYIERMLTIPEIARTRTDPMAIMANTTYADHLRERFDEVDAETLGHLIATVSDLAAVTAMRGGNALELSVSLSALAVELLDPLEVSPEIKAFRELIEEHHKQEEAEAQQRHPAGGDDDIFGQMFKPKGAPEDPYRELRKFDMPEDPFPELDFPDA